MRHVAPNQSFHRCIRILLLVLLGTLITGCAEPTARATVRATAAAQGCWPYGQYQPPTPTVTTLDATAQTLGTPTPMEAPTVRAYATCVPLPGTPTVTPTPIPPRTPQPRDMHVGLAEVGATNGKNTNHAVAIDPVRGTAVIGWVNWGSNPTQAQDGLIWVKTQLPNGQWTTAQTLNTPDEAVNALVGGLALTAPAPDSVIAAWGDGDNALYSAESTDGGVTWTLPTEIGSWAYQVIDLKSDGQGGLHMLALTSSPHQLAYAYRPASSATWTTPVIIGSGRHYQGAFAVLDLPNGGVRRFAAYTTDVAPNMRLFRSDDGQNWTEIPVETGRFMTELAPIAPALVAAQRPDGTAVVTLAWCQYSKSGVFAQVSLDGGLTWGNEEAVFKSVIDGYWPSLAYDRASDTVVLVTTELKRRRIPPHRVRLAARPLQDTTWRFQAIDATDAPDDDGVPPAEDGEEASTATLVTPVPDGGTPTTEEGPSSSDAAPAPILVGWGWRGKIVGDRLGNYAWLVAQDERNDQDRLYAQPLHLPALLAEEQS